MTLTVEERRERQRARDARRVRDRTAERALRLAARVEQVDEETGKIVLVSTKLRKHGTMNGYSNHSCQCSPCVRAGTAYFREHYTPVKRRKKRPKWRPEKRHRCALDECRRSVPFTPGETRYRYERRRYCSDEHRETGKGRTKTASTAPWRLEERTCERDGCSETFRPKRADQRFHERACSGFARDRGPEREWKRCECGCGIAFERPAGLERKAWERRRFLDELHRRRGGYSRRPGAGEATPRRAPAVSKRPPPAWKVERVCGCGCGVAFMPNRVDQLCATTSCGGRMAKKSAAERSALALNQPRIGGNAALDRARPVFPEGERTEEFRPGRTPVVEKRVHTAPRPSFKLSRARA